MTGSISILGTVLPIGGVTAKIEAASDAGIKKVLIPKANLNDVLVEDKYLDKVEIVPVVTLSDVLEHALVGEGKENIKYKHYLKAYTIFYNKPGSLVADKTDHNTLTREVFKDVLKEFEKKYSYRLRSEDIVGQGYFNATYRIPKKPFLDWMNFTQEFVRDYSKKCVEKVHRAGKKAILFF